jgi:oligosaccharyltransferase complex subunit alpha (ribophorin I)
MNGGRKVISLKSKNIVEEHDKKVTISYEFAQARMLVEPVMLVSGFLVFFFACIVLSRVSNVSSNLKTVKVE